jgi:hypothetical protein
MTLRPWVAECRLEFSLWLDCGISWIIGIPLAQSSRALQRAASPHMAFQQYGGSLRIASLFSSSVDLTFISQGPRLDMQNRLGARIVLWALLVLVTMRPASLFWSDNMFDST